MPQNTSDTHGIAAYKDALAIACEIDSTFPLGYGPPRPMSPNNLRSVFGVNSTTARERFYPFAACTR